MSLACRPQQSLFVDFVCINQLNTETKTLGVLNLGAILKKSRKMLVLYDPCCKKFSLPSRALIISDQLPMYAGSVLVVKSFSNTEC